MDNEKLILLVFDRRVLWDQKYKGYHNRDKSRKLWEEVATELNVGSETAKSKWKGLRDTFRREYQKVKIKCSGDEGGEQVGSTWPYYDSLCFLADQMTPRESAGNVPPVRNKNVESTISQEQSQYEELSQMQSCSDDYQDDVRNQPVEEETPSICTVRTPESTKKHPTRSLKHSSDIQKRMIEVEEEKLKFFKQRKVETTIEKNYDYYFLMGLLPHLQKVKPERKPLVQLQLQQVLVNEVMSYTQPVQHTLSSHTFSAPPSTQTSYTPQPTPSPSLSESSLRHSYISLSSPVSPSNNIPKHLNSAGSNVQDSQLDIAAEEQSYSLASYVTNFQM
nr:uncharacterized protein LOC111420274 [Onthophagus taurus]